MNLPIPPEAPGPSDALPEDGRRTAPGFVDASAYKPRVFLPVLFFVLTLFSTTFSGSLYHRDFRIQQSGIPPARASEDWHLVDGIPYAFAVVGILLAHELGHYLACRFYGIAATLPFFIPFPLLSYAGTMGAFIRIRSPFSDRKKLFDVGVAGPLAGYAFAVPALIVGIRASQVIPFDPNASGYISFGEPLIFKLVAHYFFSYSEVTETLNLHPIGWAAWFGIFATSINLFPIGQLDGGHMTYALFGRAWHRKISIAVCAGLALLSTVTWSPAYLFFSVLVVALGLRHPQTLHECQPLDRPRTWIAVLAALIFIVSFIPVPISVM